MWLLLLLLASTAAAITTVALAKTDGAGPALKPGTHPPIIDPAWSPTWQFSFHPVAPHIGVQGDSCGGLIVNGTYHFMTSCGGGMVVMILNTAQLQ